VDPIVVLPGEGKVLKGSRTGSAVIREAGPALSVLEFELGPAHPGVAPHFHKLQIDSFYVLEGEVDFRIGDETVRAPRGSYVSVPPGVVHGLMNAGASSARLLNVHVPGGFAEYSLELNELRLSGVEPDEAFFERHDIYEP
jgi:quercetin dioxygenase-like cupin family protein